MIWNSQLKVSELKVSESKSQSNSTCGCPSVTVDGVGGVMLVEGIGGKTSSGKKCLRTKNVS
jgi:hypothetical protein